MTHTLSRITLTLLLAAAGGMHVPPAAQADPWAEAMAAFDQQDQKSPPAAGGIVFVGSSSIRLWDCLAEARA